MHPHRHSNCARPVHTQMHNMRWTSCFVIYVYCISFISWEHHSQTNKLIWCSSTECIQQCQWPLTSVTWKNLTGVSLLTYRTYHLMHMFLSIRILICLIAVFLHLLMSYWRPTRKVCQTTVTSITRCHLTFSALTLIQVEHSQHHSTLALTIYWCPSMKPVQSTC